MQFFFTLRIPAVPYGISSGYNQLSEPPESWVMMKPEKHDYDLVLDT